MFVLAVCEAEVRGDLLAFGFFVLVGYSVAMWVAVLRGPANVRRRALLAYGLGVLVGGVVILPQIGGVGLSQIAVGPIVGGGLAALVSRSAGWMHPPRLIGSGALGSLLFLALFAAYITLLIGSGSTCLD